MRWSVAELVVTLRLGLGLTWSSGRHVLQLISRCPSKLTLGYSDEAEREVS